MDLRDLKENYIPISDRQVKFLDNLLKEYNPQNEVTKIDVTSIYNTEFRGSPNEQCYCSPYTLLRLFAVVQPRYNFAL